VIVTGALLAESASAVDNKLNIQGGVASAFRPGPDRVAPVTLVLLLKPEPGETSAVIDVTVSAPTGESVPVQVPVPESSLGGEIGFMYTPLPFSVPVNGRYVVAVSTGTGVIELPLNVVE
jgi:hypothetical protein